MAKTSPKEAALRMSVLQRLRGCLDEGKGIRILDLSDAERAAVDDVHLITSKPVMYIANVAEGDTTENPWLEKLRKYAANEQAEVIPVCAGIEAEISQLNDEDRKEFLQELGLSESGLDQVIRTGYRLLKLLTFFTAGKKEVRAWTVHAGATAPQAAGRIHTDFERGFIRAEVTAFEDFVRFSGEQGAKEAGKLRVEGKTYLVNEGDVMHFRFNV
jgi:GTP-binding protein YchF